MTTPAPVKTLLLAADLGMEGAGAAATAAEIARRLGAAVHIAYALEPLSALQQRAMPGLADKHAALAQQELAAYAKAHDLPAAQIHILQGDPERAIPDLARRINADLLVIGRYGRGGPKPGAIGSVATQLLRRGPADVLVVQPTSAGQVARVGVASDLEDHPEIAVNRALDIARRLGLPEIVLLHAYEVPPGHHVIESWEQAVQRLGEFAREEAEALARRLTPPSGPAIRVRVEEGPLAQTLARMAEQEALDLLVISTHRRTNPAEVLLTRRSEKIIAAAPCSVWAEKDPSLFQNFMRAVKEWLD